ncbi:hypothetical protein glysoja_046347 [Glycine soja]|uniref:Uncharacterized protein n=1 Tax=Glycine soja TaxID=3848 RepID=A0A0B2PM97_GLYSO|nr:hypothetical protein JHK87_031088 [Glycine soja]KHN08819.1 hypothetical protein glysoja_046347 [Glycine soja]
MINNVSYADNVVRVSVVIVYDGDAQIPFPTSEIRFVREVVNTFIGWLTHLVKAVSDEDSHNRVPKPVGVAGVDPLGELMKNLFDVYQKLVE